MDKSLFTNLSTAELVERIAFHSDIDALNYFLSERRLIWENGERYLLSEYLWKLRKRNYYPYIIITKDEKNLDKKIDRVYDLTLKKFSNLKPLTDKEINKDDNGPYCNNQYMELYEKIRDCFRASYILFEFEQEQESERIFKNIFLKNLKYSWQEACRLQNPAFHRYTWHLKDGNINLMKPIYIPGRDFRKWLENNINDPDLMRPGEKQRIQDEVYKNFGYGNHISLDTVDGKHISPYIDYDPIDEIESKYIKKNFYRMVSDEKSENIEKLSPSIRRLGKKRVRELVLRILDEFTDDNYSDTVIAEEFGLTKPTYSRFAGRKWERSKSEKTQVPVLWKNIAKIVNSNPHFIEAAINFGIKSTIDAILKPPKKGKNK